MPIPGNITSRPGKRAIKDSLSFFKFCFDKGVGLKYRVNLNAKKPVQVVTKRQREDNFFTSEMIKQCMKKVTVCGLHQVIKVDDQLSIKAYYAGHVLGAAMFKITVGSERYHLKFVLND